MARSGRFFDVLFGILLPIFCLAADPVVFAGWAFQPVAVAFIVTEAVILWIWLGLRGRLRKSAIWFAGPLAAGGIFALALGTAMLPLSLLGLLLLIGILGFTPFLTAFCYFRAAAQAWRRGGGGRRAPLVFVAGLLFAATPALVVLQFGLGRTVVDLAESAARRASPAHLAPED